jgi:hypothetical protein
MNRFAAFTRDEILLLNRALNCAYDYIPSGDEEEPIADRLLIELRDAEEESSHA